MADALFLRLARTTPPTALRVPGCDRPRWAEYAEGEKAAAASGEGAKKAATAVAGKEEGGKGRRSPARAHRRAKSLETASRRARCGNLSQPMYSVSQASEPSVRASRRSSSVSASFSPRLSFFPL